MEYTIYTDGAYSQIHKEGAFAFVILNYANTEITRKAYKITNETNNRAELKAIIAAVYNLPNDATEVKVYSDSEYALKTLSFVQKLFGFLFSLNQVIAFNQPFSDAT